MTGEAARAAVESTRPSGAGNTGPAADPPPSITGLQAVTINATNPPDAEHEQTEKPKYRRKAVTARTRFEVFKRDQFTCQYCGATAPDAVLHVDHIEPVADGGGNDLVNLITACKACNGGKGARKLSDSSSVAKQMRGLKDLAARREQLEMVAKWRVEMTRLHDEFIDTFDNFLQAYTGSSLSPSGRSTVAKWSRRFSADELLEALEISCRQYEDTNRAFAMVPAIIRNRRVEAEKPYWGRLLYTRGILRRRLRDRPDWMEILDRAHLSGWSLTQLDEMAREARSVSQFINWVNRDA